MIDQYALAAMGTVAATQSAKAIKRETEKALTGEVSVEYVLLAGGIAIAIIGAVVLLGTKLDKQINFIATTLGNFESIS